MAIELTPQQKDILIRTALGEARGEGVEGMADVIQVIFNRAQSGQYPADPAAVATQPYQFSTWNKGEGGNNPQQFKPSDPVYKKAEQALEAVVSGSRPDYTGGALFYHTPAVNPNWAGEVNRFGTIERNGHIFYPSRPVPPGEIPNVVASQLDTTPQTRDVPRPQPRPQRQNLMDMVRPRLTADGSNIYSYQPEMTPTSVTRGLGSLTPNAAQETRPSAIPQGAMLPNTAPVPLPRPRPSMGSDPGGGTGTTIATIPTTPPPYSAGTTIATVPTSGIGQPPATRSVPSIPVRPSQPGPMNDIGQLPSFNDFLGEMNPTIPGPNAAAKDQARLTPGLPQMPQTALGLGAVYPMMPQVGTALSVTGPQQRPTTGFPTPISQRPMPRLPALAMPTPLSQRPVQRNPNALRITVNGGNYAQQPTREQQIAAILARSRGPAAFGGGGTIDGAVQPVGTIFGRR